MFREGLTNISPIVPTSRQTPCGLSNLQPPLTVICKGTNGHDESLIAGRFNKVMPIGTLNPCKS